jgi:hypothetical protein
LTRLAKTSAALAMSRVHASFRMSLGSHQGVANVMDNVRKKAESEKGVVSEAIAIASAEASVQSQ